MITDGGRAARGDLYLGDDRWIDYIPIDDRHHEAYSIDTLLLANLEPLWRALETICVAGCCGMDAFSYEAEDIAAARTHLDVEQIRHHLIALMAAVLALDAEIFVSQRLNAYLHRDVLVAWLSYLANALRMP